MFCQNEVKLHFRSSTIFHRPSLMHSIDLFHGANLTVTFSLRMSGSTFPMVLPFFTHMNPGFRIYIGDDLVFDYSSSGIFGSGWHTYVLAVSTESVMTAPHQANKGKERQIVSGD